ncbi:MAG TPA: hypothetical protein VGP12_04400 [Nitrosospira sp.]|nr:hypothetical protein [Nitrosospira sp.]
MLVSHMPMGTVAMEAAAAMGVEGDTMAATMEAGITTGGITTGGITAGTITIPAWAFTASEDSIRGGGTVDTVWAWATALGRAITADTEVMGDTEDTVSVSVGPITGTLRWSLCRQRPLFIFNSR